VRKHRAVGGTHRDSALPSGAVKVGVLGVLATATIAAPLAAAAAGVDESSVPQGETLAQSQPAAPAPQAPAPVALPVADSADAQAEVETRGEDESATRTEERTSPATEKAGSAEEASADASEEKPAEDAKGDDEKKSDSDKKSDSEEQSTGIEVSVPEPEPVVAEGEAAAASDGSEASDGSDAPVASSGYVRPVGGPITSGYGGRVHPVLGYYKGHDGVDFGAACGTPVGAAQAGTVVAVEYHHASGNRVKIDHGNGVVTGYYHLQGFSTSVGSTVSAGETVGYVGSTGRSTGCHLHFAKMDEAGNYSNPMSILR